MTETNVINKTEKGSIKVGKFDIGYCIEGTGTPAIVVGGAIYYPRTFSQNLRKHIKFIFADQRCLCKPPDFVEASDFTLDKLVDEVEAVRQALKLERIIVMGHSANAYIALEYAKKYPQHVSHVVLIGISPDLGPASLKMMDDYWHETASEERKAALDKNLKLLSDEALKKVPIGESFVKDYVRQTPMIWYDFTFDAEPLWDGTYVDLNIVNQVWGTVFADIDITKNIEAFKVPVFLALGRYDFCVAPPKSWEGVASKFHDLTTYLFEKSGHTPQYEEAELFDKAFLEWLSEK